MWFMRWVVGSMNYELNSITAPHLYLDVKPDLLINFIIQTETLPHDAWKVTFYFWFGWYNSIVYCTSHTYITYIYYLVFTLFEWSNEYEMRDWADMCIIHTPYSVCMSPTPEEYEEGRTAPDAYKMLIAECHKVFIWIMRWPWKYWDCRQCIGRKELEYWIQLCKSFGDYYSITTDTNSLKCLGNGAGLTESYYLTGSSYHFWTRNSSILLNQWKLLNYKKFTVS